MPETSRTCPKCNRPMERGFTVDMGAGNLTFGERNVSRWAPGAPLKSLLFRTWVPQNSLPIGTFRCTSCGYLESYAAEQFASTSNPRFSLRTLFIFVTVVAVVLGIIGAIIFRNAR